MNTPNYSDTYAKALIGQIKKVIGKLSVSDNESKLKQSKGTDNLGKHMIGQFNDWMLLDEDSLEIINLRYPESQNSSSLA